MKRPRRKTLIVAALAFLGLSFGVWAAIYAYDKGFTRRWRTLIKEEFAAHGIEATIGKLTIDPLEGLVARDLRVYEDKDHERLLASISQMALDIDSARVAKGELFINELTIADADVWLPLDPEDKSAGRVEIRRVNARILLPEDRIEFRSAEGDLYGINVSLAGSVFQPKRAKNGEESDPKPPQPGEKVARALKGWDLTPEAVEAIKGVVRVLKRMEYERGSQPRLDLELYGDLAERKDLRAIARLSSGPFRYEGWRCGEFDALAEFDAGRFGIRHLTAKDEAGEFKGSAELSADGRAATVRFRSTIDLPRLIREAMDEPRLGEVIFYEPPDITAEGTVDLNGAWKPDDWPVKLIGRVDARKFLTRGIVFDAFRADFSAAGRRFFLRNAALEHDSGGATGQALYDGESLRFEAKARMDPSAFAPFAAGSRLGTLLADLEAGSDSTFRIDLRGGGTGPLGTAPIAADGEFDLRDFSLGDYQIGRLEAKLRLAPGEIALDHPYAELPEGTARAARLAYREADDTLAIDRWEAEIFPADFMRPMNPELAAEIARVDFGVHPPLSRGSGLLSLDDRAPDRISATLMAQNRTLIHGGAEPLAIDGFEAVIDLDGVALGIAARGQALGGAIAARAISSCRAGAASLHRDARDHRRQPRGSLGALPQQRHSGPAGWEPKASAGRNSMPKRGSAAGGSIQGAPRRAAPPCSSRQPWNRCPGLARRSRCSPPPFRTNPRLRRRGSPKPNSRRQKAARRSRSRRLRRGPARSRWPGGAAWTGAADRSASRFPPKKPDRPCPPTCPEAI
ncbi:MAG: hypothetical protein R3F11_13625 [Verrucomicrobiales bacterium]